MYLSFKKLFLFVHIPRTAGKSIVMALEDLIDYYDPKHPSMDLIHDQIINGKKEVFKVDDNGELTKFFGKEIKTIKAKIIPKRIELDHLFKFSFVRNPFSREVSRFIYAGNRKDNPKHVHTLNGFDAWVEWVCENDVQLQADSITNFLGNPILDFCGKYENLVRDFGFVCEKCKLGYRQLLHLDYTDGLAPIRKDFGQYRSYYNDYTKHLIEEYFKEDLERLNYEF